MVMPPRNPSVLDAVQSVLLTIRKQEKQSLHVIDQSALSIEEWLKNVIQDRQQQVVANKKEERKEPAKKKPKVDEQEEEGKLPEDVVDFVMAQKVPELRGLLRERGLDPYGLKKVLQQRLLAAMDSECAKSEVESIEQEKKSATDPPEESSGNTDMDELEFREDEEEMKVNQPIPSNAKQLPAASHPETSQPTLQQPIELTVVEPPQENNESIHKMDVDDSSSVVNENIQDEMMECNDHEDVHPGENVDQPSSHVSDTDNQKSGSIDLAAQSPAMPSSPVRPAQSPLQQIASGVKSALKKLSPLKHKSAVAGMIEKLESSSKQTPRNDSFKSLSSDSKSHNSSFSNERVINGAARMPLTSSSFAKQTKKPMPVVSKNLKAAQEARRERLAELRNKSKPAIFTSTSTMSSVPAMPKVKPLVGSASQFGKETSKRNILAQQMRQKAALKQADTSAKKFYQPSSGLKENSPNKVSKVFSASKSVRTLGEVSKVSASSSGSHKMATPSSTIKSDMATPASTKKPDELLSPLDTYELSDREQSDSDSDDDENYGKPKKRIPEWAQKSNLMPALQHQFGDKLHDPDQIFGEVQTCDLQAIFDKKKDRYKKRTSTGNWAQDRATAAEKLAYKRAEGFSDES